MKRWIALAVFTVLLSTAATVALQYMPAAASPGRPAFPAAPAASTGPTGKVAVVSGGPLTYEFGTLPQQVTGKHTWVIKNEGAGDLDLWMIDSTCSCTLAKFKNGEKAVVKPGESTEIDLEFETRANHGDYSKGARIGTNDPGKPEFNLQVHGKVFPAVMTFPPGDVINYSNIANDVDSHPNRIAIYSQDRPDLKILKTSTSKPDQITVKTEPLSESECADIHVPKGIKVTIDVKSGLPLGLFKEEVVLTTDHPNQPELRLSVVGKMSGPVNLLPERLQMHNVDGAAGARQDLIISVRKSRETTFEVTESPKGLNVEIAPIDPAKKGRYRLTVVVPPGTPAQEIEGDVVLKTDHPKAEKVIVPVSVWVHTTQ